jgi:uncharacterized protein with von Willebrand factor type A (vWA) domain
MASEQAVAGGGAGTGAALTRRLSALARELRSQGVRVGVGELLSALRALEAVDAADSAQARLALRATLCSRREDLSAFDAAFARWRDGDGRPWLGDPLAAALGHVEAARPRAALAGDEVPRPPADGDLAPLPAAWSDIELLLGKDFASYTEAERALAHQLIRRLAHRGPLRTSRRTRGTRRRTRRPDLAATLRASLRHGGVPVERRWREPRQRRRPLVLVCDVSGSMASYARMLLLYLQASVAAGRRVEAFVFGTRLTRVTRELSGLDADRAVQRAVGKVSDWSGGTRIGSCLGALNRRHGARLRGGAVLVVLSDGWDRGDPELLSQEMARLQRTVHRLVWMNPLKANPEYEPLTRGMRAALPHIDNLLSGHSIASLVQLADLLDAGVRR